MPKVQIVEATIEHCEQMAPYLRESDLREIVDVIDLSPVEVMRESLKQSPYAWTGLVDGEPVCIFGVMVNNVMSSSAIPWLLGTVKIHAHRLRFYRLNKRFIEMMRERFAKLHGFVDARNATSIKWLQQLGFEILPPIPFGKNGLPFHQFEMRS